MRYLLLLLTLILAACGRATTPVIEPVAPAPATATSTPPPQAAVEGTEAAPATPLPTPIPSPTVRPPVTVTPRTTAVPPTATPFPTTDELLAALTWQTTASVGGFPLQRLAGWANGFRDADYCRYGPYRWLDGENLLLMPVIGYGGWPEEAPSQITQPVVIRLGENRAWAIATPEEFCQLPLWSESRQQLVEATAGEVRLWHLDGSLAETHPGQRPLHLAPSGRRLLAGITWIDLESGQTVDFPEWAATSYAVPGWTADEQRLFACCFSYADARSGQSWTRAEFPGMFVGGRGSWPGEETFSVSQWLPGDKLVMVQELGIFFFATGTEGPPPKVAPVFEPETQSYSDLIRTLDLDTPPYCWTQIAPGGGHLWLGCTLQRQDQLFPYDPSYLVTLPSLDTIPAGGTLQFQSWSADGRFLIYNEAATGGEETGPAWLMGVDGRRRQLAETAVKSSLWHEDEAAVALHFDDEHRLHFFHAEREVSRRLEMAQPVTRVAWQPGSWGLALLTANGRAWWLADAFDAASEPVAVTPALPELHSLRWSPDGTSLAFASENHLYLVTIQSDRQSYHSTTLRFSIEIPGHWQIIEQEDEVYFLSGERYGDGPEPLAYYVYATEYANPEGRPFVEVATAPWNEAVRESFTYGRRELGAYTVYVTEDIPSRSGALTVFFERPDGYLALALTPYDRQQPYEAQAGYEALFLDLLQTVQLR
jgi:hypothetical protein